MLKSWEFPDLNLMAPLLSEDDAFNSQPLLGNIAYRIPSIPNLFGMPLEAFDQYTTLTFTVSVMANHDLESVPLACRVESNCRLRYNRNYSPVLHYLSPPVVYNEAMVDLWFDPKNTHGLITGLSVDEMLFINARVSGGLIDFESFVDSETWFGHWSDTRV
jgi:hypothetical protein